MMRVLFWSEIILNVFIFFWNKVKFYMAMCTYGRLGSFWEKLFYIWRREHCEQILCCETVKRCHLHPPSPPIYCVWLWLPGFAFNHLLTQTDLQRRSSSPVYPHRLILKTYLRNLFNRDHFPCFISYMIDINICQRTAETKKLQKLKLFAFENQTTIILVYILCT